MIGARSRVTKTVIAKFQLLFAKPPVPATDAKSFAEMKEIYCEALADIPADQLADAMKLLIKEWKWASWPTVGNVREYWQRTRPRALALPAPDTSGPATRFEPIDRHTFERRQSDIYAKFPALSNAKSDQARVEMRNALLRMNLTAFERSERERGRIYQKCAALQQAKP